MRTILYSIFIFIIISSSCKNISIPAPPKKLTQQEEQLIKYNYDQKTKIKKVKISTENFSAALEKILKSEDINNYLPERYHNDSLKNQLIEFYSSRHYVPAWFDFTKPKKQAADLLNSLQEADKEGLDPAEYKIKDLNFFVNGIFYGKKKKIKDPKQLIEADILFTTAYLGYANHLVAGRFNPKKINADWYVEPDGFNMAKHLEDNLQGDIQKSLLKLNPDYPQYEKLKQALSKYIDIKNEGGFPSIPEDTLLSIGDSSDAVTIVKKRLNLVEEYILKDKINDPVFDADLEAAVKSFQANHGLVVDGVAGRSTIKMMNVSATARIEQIRLNMERLRWLPQSPPDDYLFVNVPEFMLKIYEGNAKKHSMNVVVGTEFNSTPIFIDEMEYLVFSPTWSVPKSIVVEEFIPKLQNDDEWLKKNNFKLYESWQKDAEELEASEIDWNTVDTVAFPYKIEQQPGDGNALGKIKFMLPNNMAIYLHDTPADHLFEEIDRSYSHGCIRVEDPVFLAEYLLREQHGYDFQKISELMQNDDPVNVILRNEVPVIIFYQTAFVDDEGQINFRPDIYGHDKEQIQYLTDAEIAGI